MMIKKKNPKQEKITRVDKINHLIKIARLQETYLKKAVAEKKTHHRIILAIGLAKDTINDLTINEINKYVKMPISTLRNYVNDLVISGLLEREEIQISAKEITYKIRDEKLFKELQSIAVKNMKKFEDG